MARKEKQKDKEDESAILTRIKKTIDIDIKAAKDNYEIALNMQKILILDEHFSAAEVARRSEMDKDPVSIPVLSQFSQQLEGELLMNKFYPQVFPSDKKSSKVIANVLEGHLRDILYKNTAGSKIDDAGVSSIRCGFGAVSFDLQYNEERKFDLDVIIESEPNFSEILPDSFSKESDYSDGKHVTKFFRKSKTDFKEEYPDIEFPSSDAIASFPGTEYENWYKDETVSLAKYFEFKTTKVKWVKLSDGSEYPEAEAEKVIAADKERRDIEKQQKMLAMGVASIMPTEQGAPESTMPGPGVLLPMPQGGMPPQVQPMGGPAGVAMPAPGVPAMSPPGMTGSPNPTMPGSPGSGPTPMAADINAEPKPAEAEEEEELKIIDSRDVDEKKIQYFLITGHRVIKGPKDWPSSYLPYLMELGNVGFVGSKRVVRGFVNKGVTGQKFLDQYFTEVADAIDRQIKAQLLVKASHISGFQKEYQEANKGDSVVLPVNPGSKDDAMPLPIPIAQNGPPTAQMAQIRSSMDMIKAAIGMHGPDVGEEGGGTDSGVAIQRKQAPGDIGAFSFIDNHQKFITRMGKILLDMILKNYTSERDLMVRDLDDSQKRVLINVQAKKALKIVRTDPELYSGMDLKEIEDFIRENGPEELYNSLREGKYDVRVKAGLPHQTAREENAQKLSAFMQNAGSLGLWEKYCIAKELDGMDTYTEGLRKQLILQGIIKPDKEEIPEIQELQQRTTAVMQNNPQMKLQQAKMQEMEMKAQTEQLKIQLELAKQQTEQLKLQAMGAKAQKEGVALAKEVSGTPQEIDRLVAESVMRILPQVLEAVNMAHAAPAVQASQ
jgi:hypothetical protein